MAAQHQRCTLITLTERQLGQWLQLAFSSFRLKTALLTCGFLSFRLCANRLKLVDWDLAVERRTIYPAIMGVRLPKSKKYSAHLPDPDVWGLHQVSVSWIASESAPLQ